MKAASFQEGDEPGSPTARRRKGGDETGPEIIRHIRVTSPDAGGRHERPTFPRFHAAMQERRLAGWQAVEQPPKQHGDAREVLPGRTTGVFMLAGTLVAIVLSGTLVFWLSGKNPLGLEELPSRHASGEPLPTSEERSQPVLPIEAAAQDQQLGAGERHREGAATGSQHTVLSSSPVEVAVRAGETGAASEEQASGDVAERASSHRIQLALLRDRRNIDPIWQKFTDRFGPLSPDLKRYIVQETTGNGVLYLVQIGPFESSRSAEERCAEMRRREIDCIVVQQ